MNINTLLRFSSHGWTFDDVGLRVTVAPRNNRISPIAGSDEGFEEQSQTSSEPLATSKSYSDSVSISDEAKKKASGTNKHENLSSSEKTAESEEPQEEQTTIQDLKKRDQEVKQHEMAHKAAGGSYAGQPVYEYEQGPDGKRYAVGGHVSIDTSPEETPEATIQKAQVIKRAANAPKEPSSADKQVAAKATQMEQEARAEIATESNKEDAPQTTISENQEIETDLAESGLDSVTQTLIAQTATQTRSLDQTAIHSNTKEASTTQLSRSMLMSTYSAHQQYTQKAIDLVA